MKTMEDKYLALLNKEYPTDSIIIQEIIKLESILNLPKGTEHYISDLHGEYDAFKHLMNNCSGVIKEKVIFLFQKEMSNQEINDFCQLIYYPALYLPKKETNEWYCQCLLRLIRLARYITSKYTRTTIRNYLQQDYADIIDELIHAQLDEMDQKYIYHLKIINMIIELHQQDDFIKTIIKLIKHFAVDKLHILGDLYDRGKNPHKIINDLIEYKRVNIQWGNHDILWMGAYLGQEACIVTVVKNCVHYQNLALLERYYGIPLRNLMLEATKCYPQKETNKAMELYCLELIKQCELKLIKQYPQWHMEYRIQNQNPAHLSPSQIAIIKELKHSFTYSMPLKKHMDFIFQKGSLYLKTNHNLLLHGCIPLDENGQLYQYHHFDQILKGKAYFDYIDHYINECYQKKQQPDYFWYLWCGQYSPLCGRKIILDQLGIELKNSYYHYIEDEKICLTLLREFGLYGSDCHIINGHTPIRVKDGESPLKGNGRLIMIDGGFCKQNQKKTGVAGYTLISNSHGMRLKTHHVHVGSYRHDVEYDSMIIYTAKNQEYIKDTKRGLEIIEQMNDLKKLLELKRQNEI